MMRFNTWLKSQHGRDDEVGDLARDIARDLSWPRSSDVGELLRHLGRARASRGVLATLAEAWIEYTGDRGFWETRDMSMEEREHG